MACRLLTVLLMVHSAAATETSVAERVVPVYSYVTHAGGYYRQFQESCRRFGYNCNAVGWGHKWNSFGQRRGIAAELEKLELGQVVVVCDAWDFVFLRPSSELLQAFHQIRASRRVVLQHNPLGIPLDTFFYLGFAKEVAELLRKVEAAVQQNNLTSDGYGLGVVSALEPDWLHETVLVEAKNTLAVHLLCNGTGYAGLFAPGLWPCDPVLPVSTAFAAHGVYDLPMAGLLASRGFDPEPLPGKPSMSEASVKIRRRWLCLYPENMAKLPDFAARPPLLARIHTRLIGIFFFLKIALWPLGFTETHWLSALTLTALAALPVLWLRGASCRSLGLFLVLAYLGGWLFHIALTGLVALYCDQAL